MGALATAFKFRDLGYVLVIVSMLAVIGFQKASLAGKDFGFLKATFVSNEKAAALSDELVIEQAKASAITEKKVVTYVDRIRNVPDTPAADRERNRLGNIGVRDLILGGGPPAVGGAPAAVQGPGAGARP